MATTYRELPELKPQPCPVRADVVEAIKQRVLAATTYTYQLPDGTRFNAAADLCKGASIITFELKAVPPALRGRIVDAIIVSEPRYVTICAWCQTTPPPQAHVVYSHGICDACKARVEREG